MKYKNDINKNIFRGYDIRGVYPTEIDEDTKKAEYICYKIDFKACHAQVFLVKCSKSKMQQN